MHKQVCSGAFCVRERFAFGNALRSLENGATRNPVLLVGLAFTLPDRKRQEH